MAQTRSLWGLAGRGGAVAVLAMLSFLAESAPPAAAATPWTISSWFTGYASTLTGISCSSRTSCDIVGLDYSGNGGFVARTTDGISWLRGTPIPNLAPQHVSCPSATVCFDVIGRDRT
jgi:hypothetical protein